MVVTITNVLRLEDPEIRRSMFKGHKLCLRISARY